MTIDPKDIALTSPEATARFLAALSGRLEQSIASPVFAGGQDEMLAAVGPTGSGHVVAQTFDGAYVLNATLGEFSAALSDGRQNWQAFIVREPVVVTGMFIYVTLASVGGTGGLGRLALYRVNDVGDGYTKLGEGGAYSTYQSTGLKAVPFVGGPIALESGLYWATASASWTTAPTTIPQVTAINGVNGIHQNPFMVPSVGPCRTFRREGQAGNAPTAEIPFTSQTTTSGHLYWMGLYQAT